MNTIPRKFAFEARISVISGCLLALLSISIASGQIATGTNHTLAIQTGGTLWAWGYNYYGQLGDGTTTERTAAVEVQTSSGNLTNVSDVSAGANHSLALDGSGNMWAWGYNGNGQLGNGTTTNSSKAVQVQTASGNLTNVTAIAAGDNFTVALRNDGTVWAVGLNSNGQLGIGNTTQQTKAVQVMTSSSTALSNIVAIAAGATHTMALDSSGNVWTWGNNSSGQLGIGSTTQQTYAVQVTAISGIGQITAGASHSLAMTVQGTVVYSWGLNSSGQLGNNSNTQEDSPVTMFGISNAKNIAAGLGHSVVLENDGTVWTVGHNYVGELGIGTTVDQHEAVQVPGVAGILAIAARGDRTLMYTNVGTILGVGDDFYSGLGDGNVGYQLSPYTVSALTGVTAVSSGDDGYHSLVVKNDGTIWSAGSNSDGQLGSDNQLNSDTFAQVTKGSGYLTGVLTTSSATAAGGYHSLAVTSDNTVWGWGYESYGQVGNGIATSYVLQPAQVVTSSGTLTGITAVSAGEYHSLGLRNDGTVWAWGYNAFGQLGNNTTTNSNKAVEVLNTSGTPLSNIVAIAAGENHSLAVDSSGNLWAWGYNNSGQLGDGTTTNHLEAEQISLSGTMVTQVAGGGFYSLAITSTGTVLAWGANTYGELGDGTTTNRLTPVAVQNLTSVASIGAGQYHSIATESNGSVWTWGFNNNGQLGNGTFDSSNHDSPAQLTGITAASGANVGSAGGYHTLLINSGGVLTTWANGMYGQLGDSQFGYASSPVTAVFTVTQNTTTSLWVNGSAPSGGNGTFANPYNTIEAAINQWTSTGDTHTELTIRGGTYHECIFLDGTYHHMRSGTAGTPYLVRGMPGERVIISGMKPITGWSLYSGSIYVANLGTWNPSSPTPANTFPDTFYMGMNERLMAQQPAPGNPAWTWQSVTTSGGNTIITDTAHLVGIGTLTTTPGAGSAYIQLGITNGVQGATIVSNDPVGGTVTVQGTFSNLTGVYVIKNSLSLLTQPGQWACIPQGDGTYKMYYWPENSTEISQLTSANPPSQARDSYTTGLPTDSAHDQVSLTGVSYVNIQGLEIMGASGQGSGIYLGTDTNCNVSWCVIHDNSGYTWSGGEVNEIYGYGISMRSSTSCTASNNVLTLNGNGASLTQDTSCVISQNDIGWNYIDGIDCSSDGNLSTPCLNCTISQNYINNQYNLEQHPDSIQSYDAGVENMTISDNVELGETQSEINGMGGGSIINNLMWGLDLQNFAGKDNQDSLSYIGNCYFENNTTDQYMSFGNYQPLLAENNVDYGRWITYAANYTGNYNLIQPIPFTSSTFDPTQMVTISTGNVWSYWGYQTAAPGCVADFYAKTGQDQYSQLASPTQPQFVNMPTTYRGVDEVNHMALFVTNATSTTVPLYQTDLTGEPSNNFLGDFAQNDYIEWDGDGILRQIQSTNPTNNTITFTPPLYGFTPGDGLGYPTLPRQDWVERWGTRTNFARNCALAAGTPGLTMSSSGGPIGCSLNIGQYQVDDFNGNGVSAVPAIPPDVLANRAAHKWHLATWFSYGNN